MTDWRPTHGDPLFILAMDHRDSFGKSLFDVEDDRPTDDQAARMRNAKDLIYAGLLHARPELAAGRPGVLVDEQYGQAVIDRAKSDDVVLAVPIEASGHDWFTLEWGEEWLDRVRRISPAYAKVLVRDNPDLPGAKRDKQLADLAEISAGLASAHVPLLYELLVPGTDEQLASVGGDSDRYDRDVRPALVVRVIMDNLANGVEPALWKVEGLETVDDARLVAAAARSGERDSDLIVLGRDAPDDRLNHWLEVASRVPEFVGFAIGRSIWEDAIDDWAHGRASDVETTAKVAEAYLGFASHWR